MTDLFFRESTDDLPKIGNPKLAAQGREAWEKRIAGLDDPATAGVARRIADDPEGGAVLDAIFGNSPFLTHCVLSDIAFFTRLLETGPDAVLGEALGRLKGELYQEADPARLMTELRAARRQTALAVAVADLTGYWPLEPQFHALSNFADAAVGAALAHLLARAAACGDLNPPHPENPERDCGFVVIAMGKLGSRELNYSSDIDLIVLFDPDKAGYVGRRGPREGFVRMTRDLARMLEQRTGDGYVHRVDLRLRPDPGAMPLAISFNAAMTYYESLGQNWERAAMIKARPIAGDVALGARFLAELRPFVWRKNMDFWAIQDVHSIKRQIYAHKGGAKIGVLDHNIKLGRGGIREIEMFVQTQQLIWGGRDPRLRGAKTLEALSALAAAGHVDARANRDLDAAYRYLRRLEHRLQMVDDQQTQTLPANREGIARIAAFMGCESEASFQAELLGFLRTVEDRYAELFEGAPALATTGNLVFTGSEPEPGTLATLASMGFENGGRVFDLVRAWHHGRHRATRSTRGRQLLTELMPALLQALGKTTQPDSALLTFDQFLAGLPAGVQLFSMLHANPGLLDLLADIMGGAPALAEQLSGNAGLLESVLSQGFFDPIPDRETLAGELRDVLAQARDFEDVLDLSRRWAKDRRFQAGVHILRQTTGVDESGRALSDIADSVLAGIYPSVREEMARNHGEIDGPGLAVLALGKLGAREMTVASDLDLVFVYETEDGVARSDGAKPLPPVQYFARLAQRIVAALAAPTAEGRLYEIDMRLRPSGNAGPIATTLSGWRRYQEQEAWTWEHMALTRTRVVIGNPDLARRIEGAIGEILHAPRDAEKLLIDVAEMRARIERERPAKSLWSIKYLRGGLTDLEFLAQYLQLRHASAHPQIIDRSTQGSLAKLAGAGIIGANLAVRLIEATQLMRQVQGMLRLTAAPAFDADAGSASLQAALARAAGTVDFASLRRTLIDTAQVAYEAFVELIEEPARAAGAKLGDQPPS